MAVTIASTTGNGTGTISSPGIGSGLDVNSIVSQLMAIEDQPLNDLDTKTAGVQAKISAFGTVSSALATFQSSLLSLEQPATFNALSAASSDSSTVSASVTGSAVAGSYSVQVTQLAQAAKLASVGFASTSTNVGSGTLTFQLGTTGSGTFTPNGTTGAQTVTIPAGSQTLAGIRDAVNAANIGVSATIINDGSTNGNRLVFTSTASGAANSLKVTAADADGNNTDTAGLSQLAFDPTAAVGNGLNMTQQVAAQDAHFVIDGITVSKPSNTTTDAIQGVTLNALAVSTGAGSTVSIASSTAAATSAVQGFVTAYNTLNTTLRSLSAYDASSNTAAILTGDSTLRTIQARIVSIVSSTVPGLVGGTTTPNTLGQAGISLQVDGSLALDTTKLATALSSNGGLSTLFGAIGTASDSQVSVAQSGVATKAGTYSLNITQLATQGTSTGSAAAGLTITAGVNDQLDMTIDGVQSTVTLAAGTYASAAALAAQVQSQVNGASAIAGAGSSVSITANAGVLTATSARYGSASNVSWSGTAAATLFGSAPVGTIGIDTAGTINGIAASGSGQLLRGATGSATEGLNVTVNGGALGARGTVTFSQGYAATLDTAMSSFLGSDGMVASETTGLNSTVTDIANQRSAMAAHLAVVQANYQAQYAALDTMIASMNSTSTYLTQQLANLPKISTT